MRVLLVQYWDTSQYTNVPVIHYTDRIKCMGLNVSKESAGKLPYNVPFNSARLVCNIMINYDNVFKL